MRMQSESARAVARMTRAAVVMAISALLWVGIGGDYAFGGTQEDALLQSALSAVLAQDWQTVVSLLDDVDPQTHSVELRMIKGHGCLMQNRNDDAYCLFLSASSDDAVEAWNIWTANQLAEHNEALAILYLRGDALARNADWKGAVRHFNRVLAQDAHHYLALNGRGLSLLACGRWDDGLVDLTTATIVEDSQAAAYINLGASWILRRTGAPGAYAAFDRAANLSPQRTLALNGRGCAEVLLGRWEQADTDLNEAQAMLSCPFPVAVVNLLNLDRLQHEYQMSEEYALLAKANPGMDIQRFERTIQGLPAEDGIALHRRLQQDMSWNQKVIDFCEPLANLGNDGIAGMISNGFGQLRTQAQRNLEHQQKTSSLLNDRFGQRNLEMATQSGMDFTRFNRPMPGGVDVGMQKAFVDSGDWHVVAISSLLYKLNPRVIDSLSELEDAS